MAGRGRRRGFGHVRKLPSRRFQASFVGPDLARHTAGVTFTTKGDAEAWLGAQQRMITDGTWERDAASARLRREMTFEEFATTWLRDRPLKPRTRDGYRHLFERYLLPDFASLRLDAITPTVVRRWWAGLNPSHPTVNARAYALLKGVLNTALEDELITANPCRIRAAANPPRARSVQPASLDELETITEAMPARFRAAVLLGAWCALRIGEILELRRADIDLERGSVRVSRAVSWVRGGPVVGTPKSAAGTRSVSIPPHITADLEAHLGQHVDAAPGALLFPARSGQHLQPSVFHEAWRRARSAAGREDLRVHDLRHTGATLAAMTGASLAELQERLGHSSVGAALRYQHAARGRDGEIAALLSTLAQRDRPASTDR